VDFRKKNYLTPSIYIHVPFCRKICPFCSFAVIRDGSDLHEKYVLGIVDEIDKRLEFLKDLESKGNKPRETFLETLYIGGGTPSRLSKKNVSLLIKKIRDDFPWSDNIEISFEMNPEDVNEGYLDDLYEIGINRVSLGGQSFQASVLKKLGRLHSNNDLREAIKIIKNSGIKNWNLDLIFGVPNQSISKFKDDIEEALFYEPPHISLYGLEIHEKTKFGNDQKIIEWGLNNQEQFREMYLWVINRLKKLDLFQYEVSNFSRKGMESRNNLLVWSGHEYLGFGVGAHSFYNNLRWSNKLSIKTYLNDLNKKRWPVGFEEKLSHKQLATEFLMLSLRQSNGFNVKVWENYFGLKLQQRELDFVNKLCDSELAFWNGGNLCLTPKGFLLVDSITLELSFFENKI